LRQAGGAGKAEGEKKGLSEPYCLHWYGHPHALAINEYFYPMNDAQ